MTDPKQAKVGNRNLVAVAFAGELLALVERYTAMYPAFRIKPEGAPGSQARDEQERKMALEDSARSILSRVAGHE